MIKGVEDRIFNGFKAPPTSGKALLIDQKLPSAKKNDCQRGLKISMLQIWVIKKKSIQKPDFNYIESRGGKVFFTPINGYSTPIGFHISI